LPERRAGRYHPLIVQPDFEKNWDDGRDEALTLRLLARRRAPRREAQAESLSRRGFLTGVGAACLSVACPALSSQEKTPRFLLEWGRHGSGEGEYNGCVAIALGRDDVVYTADTLNRRIDRYTSDGRRLGGFGIQPSAGGFAVDRAGNAYVAHWSHKVVVYSPAGEVVREWGRKGSAEGEFQVPGSAALGPDGLIYVPDQGNSRVQVFKLDGSFVRKWGERGHEPGQFGGDSPVGSRFAGPPFLAFDRAGSVYAPDPVLNRIQKFTPEGKLQAAWGSAGGELGGFGPPRLGPDGKPQASGPIGVCVDRGGRIWVSATNNHVQQFSNSGRYLRGIGNREGPEPGQFHLPHALVLDSHGCLYVADTLNFRIQKFALD
jgi:tripartite motif-containing protein 71